MKHLKFLVLFLFPITLTAQIYHPQWLQSYGSPSIDDASGLSVNDNGDISFYILHNDSMTLNINGTPTFFPDPTLNGWILVQADPLGNITWAHNYEGTQILRKGHTFTSTNGQYVGIGNGTNTIDVDFGPGVANHTGISIGNFVLCKYDNQGEYIWSKEVVGNAEIGYSTWTIDEQDNIYMWLGIVGPGSIDIDPGPGVVNFTPASSSLALVKLDSSGNYIWHQEFEAPNGGNIYLSGMAPRITSNNIYLFGGYQTEIDFDPGPGVDLSTPESGIDGCITKLDLDGNYIWSKRINSVAGLDDMELYLGLVEDSIGQLYLSGVYTADIDLDPGPGVTMVNQNCFGCNEYFVVKLDSNGNFIWEYTTAHTTGGLGSELRAGLILNGPNELLLGVHLLGDMDLDYSTNSFNVSTSLNGARGFMHLDTSGNFKWAKLWHDQDVQQIHMKPNTAYTLGTYSDSINFGTANIPLWSNYPVGADDVYLTKMNIYPQGFEGHVFSYPTIEIDSCMGSAVCIVTGGTPPYEYNWFTQIDSDNAASLDSACYGSHSMFIVDSNQDTAYVDYFITDDANYFNWTNGTGTDTVYVVQENCLLDYAFPIDTAYISAFYFLFNDSLSTGQYFYAEATYTQGTDVYTAIDTVLVDNPQNVLFFFTVFCPNKQTGYNKIILLSSEGGYLSFDQIEQKDDNYYIYPNPATNSISVKGGEFDQVRIYDISGKLVKDQQQTISNINVSELRKGLYLLQIIHQGIPVHLEKLVIE